MARVYGRLQTPPARRRSALKLRRAYRTVRTRSTLQQDNVASRYQAARCGAASRGSYNVQHYNVRHFSLKGQPQHRARLQRQAQIRQTQILQKKSTALRAGATFTVGCARPAAPITQRIHPRSSGGQEFGECSRSCVGRSCRVAPATPRPPAPNSTSFKGSAVGRHPCWEITLGLTLLLTGMPR